MVTVEDRTPETAALRAGGFQRVFDQFGAHVVRDRPAGQFSGVAVDHGGQIEVPATGQRKVGDVTDVTLVRLLGGEVPLQQVTELLISRFRDRGANPATQPGPRQLVGTHHPGDALVVDTILAGGAVVQFDGHPRCPVGRVPTSFRVLDPSDPCSQDSVVLSALLTGRAGFLPGIERGAGQLQHLAQPLHLVGGLVVGDELEAVHQLVSPAKYLAALRRMSRSVSTLALSARNRAFSASSRAILATGDSPEGGVAGVGPSLVRTPLPKSLTHNDRVPRETPNSPAICFNVAPGVVSYKSTAC